MLVYWKLLYLLYINLIKLICITVWMKLNFLRKTLHFPRRSLLSKTNLMLVAVTREMAFSKSCYFPPWFLWLVSSQIFLEHLLVVRHCSRYWGHNRERWLELHVGRWTIHTQINKIKIISGAGKFDGGGEPRYCGTRWMGDRMVL